MQLPALMSPLELLAGFRVKDYSSHKALGRNYVSGQSAMLRGLLGDEVQFSQRGISVILQYGTGAHDWMFPV